MRTLHPLAQPLRLATLDTPAGTSGRNEAEEETDEIFEEKKEIDEDTSEEDEKTDEVKQTTAGPQINSEAYHFRIRETPKMLINSIFLLFWPSFICQSGGLNRNGQIVSPFEIASSAELSNFSWI